MNSKMIEELKPCPFCGEHLIEEPQTALLYHCWKHPGGACPMRDILIVDDEDDEALAEQIASWNTRAPTAPPEMSRCLMTEEASPLSAECRTAEAAITATDPDKRLIEAGQAIIDHMFDTLSNGNGVEATDGEKCWIVHSDEIEALRAALSHNGG